MSSARRYLIVGPAWVGDMVMAQSLFISLKQQYPDARIDVLAPDWSLPLLARMKQVNKGIRLGATHGQLALRTRWKTGRALRNEQYSHAIVIPRSLKSALVPWFAAARIRTGYRGEMRYGLLNNIRHLDKNVLRKTVERQVALGLPQAPLSAPPTPYPALEVSGAKQQKLLSDLGLSLDKPIIALLPGAEYGPAKQWPAESYRALAEKLCQAGYGVWIYGSDKEKELAAVISAAQPEIKNLCGKTQLVDVIDLLALNQCVVSNDSGLMHIAAAVGSPVVAIYGSSTPDYTPPLTDSKKVIYLGLACSPCFSRHCRFGHTHCLTQIGVEEVYQQVMETGNLHGK